MPATDHGALAARLAYLVALAAVAGCQSVHYSAATLPAEFQAPPAEDTAKIYLPNLASQGAKSKQLSPGDLLDVRIVSGLEEVAPEPSVLQVSQAGDIELPLIGAVRVSGLEPPDASRHIANAAVERGLYRRPSVTLEVREKATHQVTVLGAVDTPGVHELPVGGCDVLSAIAAAGGLTDEAGTEVEVMRQPQRTLLADGSGNADPAVQPASFTGAAPALAGLAPHATPVEPTLERIDLAMAKASTESSQQRLSDRDVVMVLPKKKRMVYVTGLVAKPDQFELPDDQNVHVLDALAMAGGRSSPVADKILVIRQTGNSNEPAVVRVSIAKAKRNGDENLLLAPGDLVSVETTAATTMVDAVRDFLRITLGVTSSAFTL